MILATVLCSLQTWTTTSTSDDDDFRFRFWGTFPTPDDDDDFRRRYRCVGGPYAGQLVTAGKLKALAPRGGRYTQRGRSWQWSAHIDTLYRKHR